MRTISVIVNCDEFKWVWYTIKDSSDAFSTLCKSSLPFQSLYCFVFFRKTYSLIIFHVVIKKSCQLLSWKISISFYLTGTGFASSYVKRTVKIANKETRKNVGTGKAYLESSTSLISNVKKLKSLDINKVWTILCLCKSETNVVIAS